MNTKSASGNNTAITWVVWMTIAAFMLATGVLISFELGRVPWQIQWLVEGSISDEVWRAVEAVRYQWAAAMLVALNFTLYLIRRGSGGAVPEADPEMLTELMGSHADYAEIRTHNAPFNEAKDISVIATDNKVPSGNVSASSSSANADAQLQIATDEIARLRRELLTSKQQLDTANKAKSQFLANMSHELRTPMNGIMGMSDLLLGGKLEEREKRFVESISASATTLLAIINDLLDFSKIESGALRLERGRFSVRDCVEDVCSSLAGNAHSKNIELICYVDDNVPAHMDGDPNRIRQILNNLVSNAIAFTHEGEVVVRLTQKASSKGKSVYQCDVQDTGAGISPELQLQLFEAFTQADESSTRGHAGLGMGLAIVRQLVSMMNGEVTFRSRLGEGSRFSFTMELEDVSDAADSKARRRDLQDARVLVVDDNETNRAILYHQLSNWGLIVETVESGAQALAALRTAHDLDQGFDMLVLDLHMPEMDGIQLATAIQAEADFCHIQSIMLTSAIMQLDSVELQRLGICQHVSKPARQSVLHDSLASMMPVNGVRSKPSDYIDSPVVTELPAVNANVLLVEDNTVNQEVAIGMLERLGCTVAVATDGLEAVSMASEQKYDIVLMDCQMPVMDGYDATRRIKNGDSINSATPIIALTAHAMHGEREKCMQAGMDDYLSKPVRTQVLLHTLKKWVSQPILPFNEAEHSRTLALAPTGDRQGDLPAEFIDTNTGLVNDQLVNDQCDSVRSGSEKPEALPPADDHSEPMQSGQAGPIDNVVNLKAIDTVRSLQRPGKPDLLSKVIGMYLDKSPESIANMQSGLEDKDYLRISSNAHSLKSSSAYLGADSLSNKCRLVEKAVADGSEDELDALIEAIAADYDEVALALREIVKNSGKAA